MYQRFIQGLAKIQVWFNNIEGLKKSFHFTSLKLLKQRIENRKRKTVEIHIWNFMLPLISIKS